MNNSTTTLAQVTRIIDGFYPPSTAQSWDAVGLVTGDPAQAIERVLFAVDPALDVIDEAVNGGYDLLVTHHPLLMRGVKSVATTSGKGRAVTALVVGDVALYAAHTNADVATPGVNDALAVACGLRGVEPLVETEGQPLGRVGDLESPMTLRAFCERLASKLPPAPVGLRVSGDPDAEVARVAVLGGAGDGEFGAARAAGADVYVTADLRHHPAIESREEDAAEKPLFLVDAGHWASEWLWLEHASERLRDAVAAEGADLEVAVSRRRTDPWDFLVSTSEGEQQ